MGLRDRVVGAMVTTNNDRVRSVEGVLPNPRDLGACAWHGPLVARVPEIRAEWDAFVAADGRTPRIEDVLDESQGNDGDWRFGLLVSRGRVTELGGRWFPRTVDALSRVDGVQAAMFSVLEPGASLPAHAGSNAGVLRYHLGIDCGTGSSLTVGDVEVPYRDGIGVLFDDTVTHSARNSGATPRVTLFCELVRPLPQVAARRNAVVQWALGLDPRYRKAVDRADRWHAALNPRTRR